MTEVREHLTERLSKARVQLEVKRSVRSTVVLLVAAAITAAGGAWILAHVASHLLRGSQTVQFEVTNANRVKAGINELRVKGIPAGRITKVELDHDRPVITAKVEKKYGPIYKDARSQLRPSSALEDQYIDIVDPGNKSAGEASENKPLASSQTETPTDIDDVLNVFQSDKRARLRQLLANLGEGTDDRGVELRQTFVQAVPLVEIAGKLSKQLARREPMTKRLVHNVGILTGELANRDRELRTLVNANGSALSKIQERRGDLDATLRELPPTLTALNSSFAATRGVLPDVNGALRSLYPVADKLPSGLTAVKRLADSADPAVAALQRPVRRLVPLATSLRPLSASLDSSVTRLRPQTDTVNKVTRDLANCKKGIQGFFQWDASLTKYGDSRGSVPRGQLVFGLQSAGVSSPDERAYSPCTPGPVITGRPPRASDGN